MVGGNFWWWVGGAEVNIKGWVCSDCSWLGLFLLLLCSADKEAGGVVNIIGTKWVATWWIGVSLVPFIVEYCCDDHDVAVLYVAEVVSISIVIVVSVPGDGVLPLFAICYCYIFVKCIIKEGKCVRISVGVVPSHG